MRPLILLTNDDGYFSEGIQALSRNLRGLARIYIVAPDRERSATSLSLTLRRPLRVQKIKRNIIAVDGTPADCVYLALQKCLPRRPDLIISGLNHGPNLGRQDVAYSGTVAAALQGTFLQIPSVAVSLLPDEKGKFACQAAAEFMAKFAKILLNEKLPLGVTLNINFPHPPFRGLKITKLGEKRYNPEIIEKQDPRGDSYFWIGAGKPTPLGGVSSDVFAVARGCISITPLHTDLTDTRALTGSFLKKVIRHLP